MPRFGPRPHSRGWHAECTASRRRVSIPHATQSEMKRILVLGAGRTAGRNFVAALRMADAPTYVVGADTNAFHLACSDADATYLVPDPETPDYVEMLLQVIAS